MAETPKTFGEIAALLRHWNPAFQRALVEIYSTNPEAAGILDSFLPGLEHPFEYPVIVGTSDLQNFPLHYVHHMKVNVEGSYTILNKVEKIDLPRSLYLLFVSPLQTIDGTNNCAQARASISVVKAVVAGALGRGILVDKICELEIATDGMPSFGSEVVRLPQDEDDIAYVDASIFRQILERLIAAPPDLKERATRSLELVGNALTQKSETFRFIDYWVALELAANGTGDAIATRLAKAYGHKKNFAYDDLEFRVVSDLRSGYLHKGKSPNFTARIERLMKAYQIDILRDQLGLDCAGLAQSLIKHMNGKLGLAR